MRSREPPHRRSRCRAHGRPRVHGRRRFELHPWLDGATSHRPGDPGRCDWRHRVRRGPRVAVARCRARTSGDLRLPSRSAEIRARTVARWSSMDPMQPWTNGRPGRERGCMTLRPSRWPAVNTATSLSTSSAPRVRHGRGLRGSRRHGGHGSPTASDVRAGSCARERAAQQQESLDPIEPKERPSVRVTTGLVH